MKKLIFVMISLFVLSCAGNEKREDSLDLESKLDGKWVANAFSGELHEEWNLGKDGWMNQQAHYIEKHDTSYSAITKIEKVGKDLVLFSIIKGSNPKIFRCTDQSEHKIVFENRDYKNPFQVKYEFINEDNYRRTIMGYENDSLVTYEFNFEKK